MAAAVLWAGLAAGAEDWMANVPDPVPGPAEQLGPCRVVYKASWSKFMEVGSASITLTPEVDEARLDRALGFLKSTDLEDIPEGAMMGIATVSTQGPVRFMWSYDADVFSVIDPERNRPEALHFKEIQKGERVDFYGEFASDRFRSFRDRDMEFDREGKVPRSLTFKDIPRPLDLLSSILHFRSQPLEVGDEVRLVCCPNENPYLVIITVESHEDHVLGEEAIPAIRLGIALKTVEKDGTLEEHEKFTTATVWLDRETHRLPLEIRAEVFVGSVRVILDSFEAEEVADPEEVAASG